MRRETIGLSYLNALEYCPRRFYYEFVQGDMIINDLVLEGTLLHELADQAGQVAKGDGEVEIRHLYLYSETLSLSGFGDIVEQTKDKVIPVEYKRGRQGKWINDHIQLCAQALCLEERQPAKPAIAYGYIFYAASKRRERVNFTAELRAKTLQTIELAFELAEQGRPPPPLEGKLAARCPDCSLLPMCMPSEVKLLRTKPKGGLLANTLSN